MDRVRRIDAICRAHGVALGAAALQFPLTHPSVVSVIPGMASPEQVAFNAARMADPIPDALWSDLKAAGLLHAAAPAGRAAA